jgi:BirA family biotin operon repressor/biotin-[acetyl-CoA-carboxylase] ligase
MEFRIENLKITDSTNTYLQELYSKGKTTEGHLIIADYQRAGKGQEQNVWHSEAGKNLLMSLLLKPLFLEASSQFLLNQVISIALKETVAHFLTNKTVCIKWPNDIYVDDMKVAGILIRHFITGSKIDASIAGIGLNIQQEFFPGHIPNPCSLYSVSREMFPPGIVLNVLLDQISHHYENLRCSRIRNIETIYSQSLYRIGKPSEFRIHKKPITATITGTDQYGRLLLTGSDGTAYCCDLKEIEYVI